MKVSFFQDQVGQFVNNHPKFMIKLGNWETHQLQDKLINLSTDSPIYITGLARSGTTILLEKLAEHPDLVSYRYKDFPLVHIPVWWEQFLKRASSGKITSVERAHKDRIKITPDSSEAMEEILWMSFFKEIHDTSKNNLLDKNTVNNDFVEFYKNNIQKLLFSRNRTRYIAKGNYNISRITFLNTIFPNAKFIVAIRNPVDHIASLMKQHSLFCKLERANKKILSYMQILGHFEFGLDRRPINFNNSDVVSEIQECWNNGDDIKGWALYWSSVYSYFVDLLQEEQLLNKIKLVNYDDLCKNPLETLHSIYDKCELNIDKSLLAEQAKTISAPEYYKNNFTNKEIDQIIKETESTIKRVESLKDHLLK
ncbi:MAG: sulfotransferase [Planctomycetia bacterium]|nr:sulfotransferase [Planctomycetia bacterium]